MRGKKRIVVLFACFFVLALLISSVSAFSLIDWFNNLFKKQVSLSPGDSINISFNFIDNQTNQNIPSLSNLVVRVFNSTYSKGCENSVAAAEKGNGIWDRL